MIDNRLYWNEYSTGDLKSALYNGSDVKTVVNSDLRYNWGLDTNDDFIFFSSQYSIFKIAKSFGQAATVVHRDTAHIHGVVFYRHKGKNICLTEKF